VGVGHAGLPGTHHSLLPVLRIAYDLVHGLAAGGRCPVQGGFNHLAVLADSAFGGRWS
jgi:hypothetical protein